MLVTHEWRRPGEDLQGFAWRHVYTMASAPGRRLVDAGETKLSGRPAFRVSLEWSEAQPMREEMAWIDGGDGSVLVVTCIATAAQSLEVFEVLLTTLRVDLEPPVLSAVAAY
jgi:hypothetical protein